MIGKDEGEDNSGENSWRTERSRTIQSSPTGAGTVSKQPPRTSLRRLVLCCAYEFDKRKKKTGEGLGILTFILPKKRKMSILIELCGFDFLALSTVQY